MKRDDDFEIRREHLKDLTDAELETRFWSLIEELIDPLLKLGYENLMEHGAGNVVYRLSKKDGTDVRTAGLKLMNNGAWEEAEALFGGENA